MHLQQLVFFAAHMRLVFELCVCVGVSNISFIITGPRKVELIGEMLEIALLDPDKDMRYLHGTGENVWIWSTVDIRPGTVLP